MRRPLNPKRWQVISGDAAAEEVLTAELRIHPIVARLLVQRGLSEPGTADAFLNPTLDRIHDPFLLPDAEAACIRIKAALAANEKILVHGDYDGDGVTSAALWTRCLKKLGADVDTFVPHRKRNGYDIRVPIIDQAKADGVTLIITTDCGIQRVDEVEHARDHGIDVIITDHHMPNMSGSLPKAIAVVNPQRKDSVYPFKHLAGVGVAFKLCEALVRTLGQSVDSYRRAYMDLAAIGTITDVMPLLDENRIIVNHGLQALECTRKLGLRALLEVTGYSGKPLDTRAVSHSLGPRLNAASRVNETVIALNLLMTHDELEAQSLARRLHDLNSERQEIQAHIFEEAMQQIASLDKSESRCLVVAGEGWSGSVVGIVASKIVDRFHRPCIVIALDEATGMGRGSARSISAFNMFDAIHSCRGLLEEYGGHAHAAGLAIDGVNVAEFTDQMEAYARTVLTDEDCVPTIEAAMEIDPADISVRFLEQIASMAPFGNGNPEPCFVSRSVSVRDVVKMGGEGQHLKLRLHVEGINGNDLVDAPWFFRGEIADSLEPGGSLDICYRPSFNEWNGRRRVQFLLEDLQPPEW